MNALSPKARELLELQRQKYLGSLPGKQARINRYWSEVRSGGWHAGQLEKLRTEIHRLSGSAGSYGLDDLGAVAQKLDRMFSSGSDPAEHRSRIGRQINALLRALEESMSGQS